MAVLVEFDLRLDPATREAIERAVRELLESVPEEENWGVSIQALAGGWFVTVKGPVQKRERLFFNEEQLLPEKIRNWLGLYPLR